MLKKLYLRDVGGNITGDGRRVRRGLLYRSSDLHRLTSSDGDHVDRLGLRQIIDLREPHIVARRPDRFVIPNVTFLPIRIGAFENLKPLDILRGRVDWPSLVHDRLYADIFELNGDHLRRFLELLCDGELPALVHCTAGKDRTGVFVAALELALGVSREQIIQSYMAILPHLELYFPRRIRWLLQKMNVPRLAYAVEPQYMAGLLDHVRQNYGDADSYLAAIGFTRPEELRARFLERD